MPNMGAKIASLNKQKLAPSVDNLQDKPSCKCRQNPCPLGGECERKDLVYKAKIEGVPEPFFYFGSCRTKFISRFANHKSSLQNRESKQGTVLSNKIWELRDKGLHPTVKFEIHKEARSAGTCDRRCDLCIQEKLAILYEQSKHMLNCRNEIYARCKHRARWKVLNHVN